MRIQAETLRLQAQVAEQSGYIQLAANLRRAAELTAVPNKEVLQIYDLLRPGRASYEQLMQLAEHLEQTYDAVETGKFMREAAEALPTTQPCDKSKSSPLIEQRNNQNQI